MATLQDIANSMFNFEGSSTTNLNHRNNNPGNLVYVGQTGATLGEGGFAKFSSWQAGIDAALAQLNLNLTRGTDVTGRPTTTLAEIILSWSPVSDPRNPPGSTVNYINTVAGQTGIDPNAKLADVLSFRRG